MNVSINWLRDYTEVPYSPAELAAKLTARGVTVEAVADRRQGVRGVVVGELLSVEKHPQADSLLICSVRVGAGEPLTIVTGAPNVAVGQKVPVAVPGSAVAGGREMAVATFRGVASQGMLCAPDELGIPEGHEGILILPDDAPVGADAVAYLGLDDAVLQLDLTTNYATHCQAMVGIAQELAAITGGRVRWPVPWRQGTLDLKRPAPAAAGRSAVDEMIDVRIDAPDLCPRYTGLIVEGVRVGPSPLWLQTRLRAAGMRPINNIVDVTNFVMLELGQPLHAFDYHKVRGRQIIVRRARTGERLVTLDGQDRVLDSDMLVIADAEAPTGLAGVMGGLESEVTPETTTIFLESAVFDGINNRATARRLNLFSEAQARFTKGVDPSGCLAAAQRAAALMVELGGGRIVPGAVDTYARPVAPRLIPLRLRRPAELVGIDFEPEEVTGYLRRLGLGVEADLAGFRADPVGRASALMAAASPWPVPGSAAYAAWREAAVAEAERAAAALAAATPGDGPESTGAGGEVVLVCVPTRRRDIDMETDLVEEVARSAGYDAIPATLPKGPAVRGGRPEQQTAILQARRTLAGLGLSETMNYSLIHPRAFDRLLLPPEHPARRCLTLANPMYEERSILRTTLLPGLLETLQYNANRQMKDVAIFEVGRLYLPQAGEALPEEPVCLGLAALGNAVPGAWHRPAQGADFFWLKGVVERLLQALGVAEWQVVASDHPSLHPGRRAALLVGAAVAGHFGEVHPTVAAAWDLPGRPVAAELRLAPLLAARAGIRLYQPLARFPAVGRDVSLVIDQAVPAAQILGAIRKAGGDLVEEVALFDRYTGEPVPAGKHSLAFSITYRSAEKTLTDAEVDAAHAGVRAALAALGAELRS